MGGPFGKRALSWSLFIAGALLARPVAAASCNYVQTFAHAVATDATIVNVFWSTNWDASAPGDLTMAAIDAYTQALVDSTYFASAADNYGTGVPTFGGSVQDATVTPTAGSVDIPYMSMEVKSALMQPALAGRTNVIVNLFVPENTRPMNPAYQDCEGIFNAFHTKVDLIADPPFNVIPIDPHCGDRAFKELTHRVSHELIETMTDPGAAGYVHNFDFPTGEVADICQRGLYATSTIPFLTGTLDPYFSDGDCGCVPTWNDPPVPFEPLKLSIDSSGALEMQMFEGRFGALPARFTLPTTANTPYLQLTVVRGSTPLYAGNSVHEGGDAQFVSIEAWDNNEVGATVARSFVRSCDRLSLQAWDFRGGASWIAHATFGSPATVHLQSVSPAGLGLDQPVTGVVLDDDGIPVDGASVQLTGGTFSTDTVTTGADGAFSATWTPSTIGTVTLTATATTCSGAAVPSTRDIAVIDAASCQCSADASRTAGFHGAGAALIIAIALVRRRRR